MNRAQLPLLVSFRAAPHKSVLLHQQCADGDYATRQVPLDHTAVVVKPTNTCLTSLVLFDDPINDRETPGRLGNSHNR